MAVYFDSTADIIGAQSGRDDDATALTCDRIAHVREGAVPSTQGEAG